MLEQNATDTKPWRLKQRANVVNQDACTVAELEYSATIQRLVARVQEQEAEIRALRKWKQDAAEVMCNISSQRKKIVEREEQIRYQQKTIALEKRRLQPVQALQEELDQVKRKECRTRALARRMKETIVADRRMLKPILELVDSHFQSLQQQVEQFCISGHAHNQPTNQKDSKIIDTNTTKISPTFYPKIMQRVQSACTKYNSLLETLAIENNTLKLEAKQHEEIVAELTQSQSCELQKLSIERTRVHETQSRLEETIAKQVQQRITEQSTIARKCVCQVETVLEELRVLLCTEVKRKFGFVPSIIQSNQLFDQLDHVVRDLNALFCNTEQH